MKILVSAFCIFVIAGAGWAQQSQDPTDTPQAKVYEVKKIPDGGFLFAIRLHASKGKPLTLAHWPGNGKENSQKPEEDPKPFSLAGSTLRDLNGDKTYTCLPRLPYSPYVGPMEVTSEVPPGGWMQFGVAFPPIPAPPDKDGKKQPYQFIFSVPQLKLETRVTLDPDSLSPVATTGAAPAAR